MRASCRLFALALLIAAHAVAAEGKWTPWQILELGPSWLRSQGLRIPPRAVWDPSRSEGLLSAAPSLGGCSAAFVSASGLLLTNHHCLFGILQQHSTPQRDLIRNGFLARTPKDELQGKAERLYVPRRFTDVTAKVLSAVPEGADDLARYKAIDAAEKALESQCEAGRPVRCDVSEFDGGLQYVLAESVQISDVRLVYAPPVTVGDYGGEVDNWSWPRHTGDFSVARAYVAPDGTPRPFDPANVPYHPPAFFPVSPDGVGPGDFVAVVGYPGRTFRALLAREMEERRDATYPKMIDAVGEWIRILEEISKEDPAGRIAVASTLKGLRNGFKNAQGQLAGFKRGRIAERAVEAEEQVVGWARSRPDQKQALEARDGLLALLDERLRSADRDMLLQRIAWAPARSLASAVLVARVSMQRQKPDAEREPQYMDRELPRLRERLEREQSALWPKAERQLLASVARRALALPAGQRIGALDQAFAGAKDLEARAQELLSATQVTSLEERRRMFDETPEALGARKDPLLELALGVAKELERQDEIDHRRIGASERLRPLWRRAVLAHAGRPVAPDANGTLRISFAHVRGYSPRDAVQYQPQTALRGMLAKETGEEPFIVDPRVGGPARSGTVGRWKDARLGDVPVDFLSDADTTGGNSGSPVIDGRGRLVGLNFDRVWENVANDFGYDDAVARNVSVDVRYLLWNLDVVEGARELLGELGVAPSTASAGPR